jgi:ribosomal protein uS5
MMEKFVHSKKSIYFLYLLKFVNLGSFVFLINFDF